MVDTLVYDFIPGWLYVEFFIFVLVLIQGYLFHGVVFGGLYRKGEQSSQSEIH